MHSQQASLVGPQRLHARQGCHLIVRQSVAQGQGGQDASAIAAVAPAPRRGWHQADPLVVADRLDVAARAPGQFADLDRGIRHAALRLSNLGLESVVATDRI